MANTDYLLHYYRRLQDNNFDVMNIVTGPKGLGKSTASVYLAREYIKKFGFICPHCRSEFYKNVYSIIYEGKNPRFELPDVVKNDVAWIECPMQYQLNMRTKKKELVGGCGNRFKYSQRKKIKWTAEKFVAYDNEDVIEKIFSLPDYSPIVADEAMKFAAGQYHNKADSKALKELMTLIRPKKFLMFLCIPEFGWLDSKYREGLSSFWLRMIERGVGVLFEKDKGEAKEKYHLKELDKMMGTIKFFTPMDKIKHNLKKHACFFDMFKFPELPEDVYDEYELVRNAVNLQRRVEEMELSNKDIAKMMCWHFLRNWDRIKIAVDRSREGKPTYNILIDELLKDPLTKKALASEVTIRNWLRGVDNYIKSKGKDVMAFDGNLPIDKEK